MDVIKKGRNSLICEGYYGSRENIVEQGCGNCCIYGDRNSKWKKKRDSSIPFKRFLVPSKSANKGLVPPLSKPNTEKY